MRVIIQRVSEASCTVDGVVTGKIGKGLVALIGIAPEDNEPVLRTVAEKMMGLRIFSDSEDKMNLSLLDVEGELLAVSQFTLYADVRKGKRPSFSGAANGQIAKSMYEDFVRICEEIGGKPVQCGIFGADMKISLVNDGPVTITIDSDELNIKNS